MNLQGRQDLPLTNLERGESWMSLSQDAGPLQVVHLHSGMVLVELPSGTRAARVALPPGRYLVRRRVDGRVYAKEYQVPGGEVTTVREAELALLGDERLAVKGTDYENWRTNYYLLGGIGAQRTLSFAMSESQYGRISSNETPASRACAEGSLRRARRGRRSPAPPDLRELTKRAMLSRADVPESAACPCSDLGRRCLGEADPTPIVDSRRRAPAALAKGFGPSLRYTSTDGISGLRASGATARRRRNEAKPGESNRQVYCS
jgi:hypothetical protein